MTSDDDAALTPVTGDADWHGKGWANKSEPLVAAPRLGAMISVRLDPDMARVVRRAARIEGVTQSEFIRRAALHSAAAVVAQEPMAIAAPGGVVPLVSWQGARARIVESSPPTTSTAVEVRMPDLHLLAAS